MMASNGFRPNHFVAFHIHNIDVVDGLVKAQNRLIQLNPQYDNAKYLTPPNGFHLTLAVMNLASPREQHECVDAMEGIKRDMKYIAQDAGPLSFCGVGSFSLKVIYAQVEPSKKLEELVDLVRSALDKAGVQVDNKPSKAHASLIRVIGGPKSQGDRNPLPEALNLQELSMVNLGSHAIDNRGDILPD